MDKHYILKKSPEYKLWRATIYQRDKWKCKICGRKERIEAHHIYPLRTHYEKRLEIENGITLCFKCHRLIFGKEVLLAEWFVSLINKNGVNSVELRKDNTEPNREGNFSEGVTTNSRGYRLEQFITKEFPCAQCRKIVKRHYYRSKAKKYFCTNKCRGLWLRHNLQGENNPNYIKPKKSICLSCKKETLTPTDRHRKKKYCNNNCQLKYEWRIGKRKGRQLPKGQWTKKFLACIMCGINKKKHYGKGKCMDCYNKLYNSKLHQ